MHPFESFVPLGFDVPTMFSGPGFRLEPLGPEHNERDHEAWMSSIDHIRATPGMDGDTWPRLMSLEENRRDLDQHAREFRRRVAFAYSVLDGDDVIGCVYIVPLSDSREASVRSWVTAERADMDVVLWRSISDWLIEVWPFDGFDYASRDGD